MGVNIRFCSLQKMDQKVIQQKNFMAPKGNKINTPLNADPRHVLPTHVYAVLLFND